MTSDLSKIYAIEQILKTLPPQQTLVSHEFCDGIYARTMCAPAGTLIVGEMHRHECFCVMRCGIMRIIENEQTSNISIGMMFLTPKMTKRIGLCLSDVVFTTFHKCNTVFRDEEEIFQYYTISPKEISDMGLM